MKNEIYINAFMLVFVKGKTKGSITDTYFEEKVNFSARNSSKIKKIKKNINRFYSYTVEYMYHEELTFEEYNKRYIQYLKEYMLNILFNGK